MSEREYYLGFSMFPGIGPKRFAQLLAYFQTAQRAWEANEHDLREAGLGEKTTAHFLDFREQFYIEVYIQQLEEKSVSFVILSDANYPHLLIYDSGQARIMPPPFVLYCKGNLSLLNQTPIIGIVGTRKITSYGRQVTELFTQQLVANGLVIVSGLALGVDTVAHQTTLDHDGKTIAVLGCGVDLCYPYESNKLYDQILEQNGLIISEFPVGMQPTKGSFPSRNRIIAGLSQGVLVTEGSEDSGALITARDAFVLSRPVFAIPGPITSSLSKGPNDLIGQGAVLVTDSIDILSKLQITNDQLPINNKKITMIKAKTKEEQEILTVLENQSLLFDEIIRKTKGEPSTIGTLLSMMELKGMIRIGDAGKYELNKCPFLTSTT